MFTYLNPNENVTHGDKDHGQDVAENHIRYEEVHGSVSGIGPHLDAELDVGRVAKDDHEIEEDCPWYSCGQGDEPYEHDHHPRSSFRYLAFQRPPYRQESETEDTKFIDEETRLKHSNC